MEAYWLYTGAAFIGYGVANVYRKIASQNAPPETAGFTECATQAILAVAAALLFAVSWTGDWMAALASGALMFAGTVFSYKALTAGGNASGVAAILNLNAVVAVPLGILFLGEFLKPLQAVGVALSLAAIALFYSPSKTSKWISAAAASSCCFGAWNYFNKAAIVSGMHPLAAYAAFAVFAAALYAAYYFGFKRAKFEAKKAKSAAVTGALITLATFALLKAFEGGSVALVVPLVNMNTLLTVILGAAFLKERLGWRDAFAVVLAIASAWLIAA